MGYPEHIIWDWNGTLLNDGKALVDSVISAFAALGLPPVTVEDHRRHFTRPIANFFEKLAGRRLSASERRNILEHFSAAYRRRQAELTPTVDARYALEKWIKAGGTNSILSMCDHDSLDSLIRREGLGELFTRVDGYTGQGPDTKSWHLSEHLRRLGTPARPDVAVLVGDTVDDALAARAAGTRCVIYFSGAGALQGLDSFKDLSVPVVRTLTSAVNWALRQRLTTGLQNADRDSSAQVRDSLG